MRLRHHGVLLVLAGAVLAAYGARAQRAAPPASACSAAGTDDRLRPVPLSLARDAARVLGLRAPPSAVRRSTVYRCLDGRVLVCTAGADLPCGKADTRRSLPAASAYCREKPDSPFIPMVVTGHETVYRWRCAGAEAVAGEPAEPLDARGFVARYWKPIT